MNVHPRRRPRSAPAPGFSAAYVAAQHSTPLGQPPRCCVPLALNICHNSLLKQLEELGLVALQLGNHLLHRTHAALVL
jgi:hypothetical protein